MNARPDQASAGSGSRGAPRDQLGGGVAPSGKLEAAANSIIQGAYRDPEGHAHRAAQLAQELALRERLARGEIDRALRLVAADDAGRLVVVGVEACA